MAAVLLLFLLLLLWLLKERLLRFRILIQIEVPGLDVLQLIAEASTDRNYARSFHTAEVNLILSATFTTFIEVAALVSFDFNLIAPSTCPSFHLADVFVIIELEPLAFHSFGYCFDNMGSWIVITLVMEAYAVDERTLSINIDGLDSREFITKVLS